MTEEQAMRRKGVWHAAQRQAMAALTCRVYAPLPRAQAKALLQQRRLGPARLRLLPKAAGGLDVPEGATFDD